MSSSAITTQVAQLKIGNVQNQADTSAVYSAGVWSFKNSTALTSVTIDNSGNVGIGAPSPSTVLDLRRGAGVGVAVTLSANGNSPSNGNFELSQAGDNSCYVWNRSNNIIAFGTNNTERMRLDSTGRLLLGDTTAGLVSSGASILQVTTSAAKTVASDVALFRTKTGGISDFEFIISRSAAGNPSWYNLQVVEQGVGFRDLNLQRHGGAVVIGSTAAGFIPGGGDKFFITANGTSTTGGYFYYNSSNQYGTVSDKRVKENIEQLDKNMAIDFVRNLKPVSFNYKENTDAGKVCGFIAQDVLAVAQTEEYKNIVSKHKEYDETNPESPLIGISDHSMTPSIVATLQHLLSVVEAQAAEIAELKAKLP